LSEKKEDLRYLGSERKEELNPTESDPQDMTLVRSAGVDGVPREYNHVITISYNFSNGHVGVREIQRKFLRNLVGF